MKALDAALTLSRATFVLDVALSAAPGETVAVLGPNGAGKSTLLATLAGLLHCDAGRVEVGGTVVDEPATGRFVAPEHRRTGVVFQDLLLFPHLSARDNVAFGLRSRGTGRAPARRSAEEWLERFGLSDHAGARPGRLSGGQAQRVALARALATEPRLLLLDEPLSALDAGTRDAVRADLVHHLRGFDGGTLVVTHDALDAMVLADRLVVLEDGRVVQQGPPGEVARSPRSRYVADLVGLNFWRGDAEGNEVRLDGGGLLRTASAQAGRVCVTVPPRAVALFRQRPEGSPRNVWPGTVSGLEVYADRARVRLDGPPAVSADVTLGAVADLALQPGGQVWVAVKASEVAAYPGA